MARATKAKSTAKTGRPRAKRAPKKAAAGSRGIARRIAGWTRPAHEVAEVSRRIEQGAASCSARTANRWAEKSGAVRVAAIDSVQPTPFQRGPVRGPPQEARGRDRQDGAVSRPGDRERCPGKASGRRTGVTGWPRCSGWARGRSPRVVPKREIAWQILALTPRRRTTCASARSK